MTAIETTTKAPTDVRTMRIGSYKMTYVPLTTPERAGIKLPKDCSYSGAKLIGIIPALNGMEVLTITKLQQEPNPATDMVTVQNHKAVTTSLMIAELFDREHKNVLRDIKNLECSVQFTELNFELSEYQDSTGRFLPAYAITKDGFVFLAMGFIGAKAAQFKETYINEFNRMEKAIQNARHLPRTKSPQDIFVLNHKAACLLFTDRNKRLLYANTRTLEQTGVNIMEQAGIEAPQENYALNNLLNKTIDDRTVQQLLDSVHYQRLDHANTRLILLGMGIKLSKGVIYIANRCPLVDDFKALKSAYSSVPNCAVYFSDTRKIARATAITLY